MIYFDSETCGLTGPMVLLQYAIDDGPIVLHEIFNEPVYKTLDTIKLISESPVVGFNLVYDWFHLTKIYNILSEIKDKDQYPLVQEVIDIEARNPSRWCLYPPTALDLMLYARKGPYQATMSRRPITIRKVPKVIAKELCTELDLRTNLPKIYFYRKKKAWTIKPLPKDKGGDNFVDVQLEFSGSSSLRAICEHEFGETKGDFPPINPPTELSYRPYGQHGDKPWGVVIYEHISAWEVDPDARYYAEQDVYLTRKLYHSFKKKDPNLTLGDTDSMLACSLGATRWKGFEINHEQINKLLLRYRRIADFAPTDPERSRSFISDTLQPEIKPLLKDTQRATLESILRISTISRRDKQPIRFVIAARSAEKRVDILQKLRDSGRFHPDFKIIGTRSNRMAGGSEDTINESINPQGIPSDKGFRRIFRLAGDNEYLFGGDAKSYEVTIMAAEFKDPKLNAELESGKKFHGLLGSKLLKMDYNDLIHNAVKYKRTKNTIFGIFYGAQAEKVSETLDISKEDAEEGLRMMVNDYPGIKQFRDSIFDQFCSMRQPNGLGTEVFWHDPAEYCETMLGFKRYFTLENYICKLLFDLSQKLPKNLKNETKLVRRERTQTATGALQSSLYACAFNIQAANLRQAGNHRIQSVGGQITKELQRSQCDLQPTGIHEWKVRTMNVHDEVLTVTTLTLEETLKAKDQVINKYRKYVPLLDWDWKKLKDWSETK